MAQPYRRILDTFANHGIADEKSLAAFLNKYPESAAGRRLQNPLADELCAVLANIARNQAQAPPTFGIQQFSLSQEPRVSDEDVRKALFLSKTATIFTNHRFEYRRESYVDRYMELKPREAWEISHDFLRDLYRFRDAIAQQQLVLLPRSITNFYEDSASSSTDLKLLEALEATNVYNVGADAELIDAIVARYKANRQLISLPELDIPWIQNLDVPMVLKVKQEHHESLGEFQKAYHQAILSQIENRRSLNFAELSRQIHHDLIAPRIARIEKDYQRAVSLHRSLNLAGAVTALLPIAAVIVTRGLMNQALTGDLAASAPAAVASLVSVIATNHLTRQQAVQALDDDEFYILWKIGENGPNSSSAQT